jgi:hypothetical protein
MRQQRGQRDLCRALLSENRSRGEEQQHSPRHEVSAVEKSAADEAPAAAAPVPLLRAGVAASSVEAAKAAIWSAMAAA